MADRPTRRILIVVGSSLRAEEADRPLAYYLRQQIQDALDHLDGTDAARAREFQILVISDFRWLREESLQRWPTISLGGPGVNALAQQWLENLPISLAVDDHYYIQMDPELEEAHVSVWGMDNNSTQLAVAAFLQRFGPRFLAHCLEHAPSLEEGDEENASEDDE